MLSPFFTPTLRVRVVGLPVAGALFMASAGAVQAQESGVAAGSARTVSVVPRVSVTETLTDNVRLNSTVKQAEQITQISPGIRISSESRRLKGYFDYSLSELVYAQNSSPGRSQSTLNTFGTLEAVDNWAYLDFSGAISQQSISVFGIQSNDNTSINANRAEVSSYRVSPYVRGRWGNWANYEARYSRAITDSGAAATSGVSTADALVKISSASNLRSLGWSANASQQRVDYSAGRSTEVERANLGLTYLVTPQLSVFANAGREANNYTSFAKESYATNGVGMNWSLSERTSLSAARHHRSFGDAHNLSFEHRTARTAWKYSDTKDVASTPNQTGIASLGSIYDILYSQFASIEHDPALRAQLVNAFLQANGISPNAVVASSFLTSSLSLTRRQNLSFALLGARDTITFLATRSESTRLDTLSTAVDDFNTSSLVRQRGFSVNYAHRLTPNYSLGILASQQNTSGDSSLQDTRLRSLNVNVTGKVGKHSSASMVVRHVVSSGSTAPYTENAVIGSLTVQF